MTTDQKEKRNDEYNKYVKRVTPTHCLSANMFKAFILVASYALSDSS